MSGKAQVTTNHVSFVNAKVLEANRPVHSRDLERDSTFEWGDPLSQGDTGSCLFNDRNRNNASCSFLNYLLKLERYRIWRFITNLTSEFRGIYFYYNLYIDKKVKNRVVTMYSSLPFFVVINCIRKYGKFSCTF